jgi:hypothetical protein
MALVAIGAMIAAAMPAHASRQQQSVPVQSPFGFIEQQMPRYEPTVQPAVTRVAVSHVRHYHHHRHFVHVADHHPAAAVTVTVMASADTTAAAINDNAVLGYYVYSELPVKPALIALASLKDVPLGTPRQEVQRVATMFGVDPDFMRVTAKIESDFDPRECTGKYCGLFQLSRYEFDKYGAGSIMNARQCDCRGVQISRRGFGVRAGNQQATVVRRPLFDPPAGRAGRGRACRASRPCGVAIHVRDRRRSREGREVVQARHLGKHAPEDQGHLQDGRSIDLWRFCRHVAASR